MLRLYLRFYLALLASLFLLVLATATLLHFTGGPVEQSGNTLATFVQNVLPPADASPPDQQRALERLASGVSGTVTLFDREGVAIASVGRPLPPPPPSHWQGPRAMWWQGSPASYLHLADGRWIAASVSMPYSHAKFVFHVGLVLLALTIGLVAFPIVRQISRRLERLQRGVELLGAGDLTARVQIEGRDEVARLAASFNQAAAKIEKLMQGHKTLLANASHELRTPLARIRLALELTMQSVDPKLKAGLEHDIAELDWLVDEILLASRLDTVDGNLQPEEVDLLALAAEECARYENVQLEGAVVLVRGEPRLLRRLLRNLLENARRHGAPPTRVRIEQQAGTAILKVWDDGAGVPPSEYENVFRPFYRARDAHDRGGAGLGLALVREIARRHGGDARCEAMPNGGSCFVVTIPLGAV